eukprot:7526722-Alexandrium_andersonii.AAC.1
MCIRDSTCTRARTTGAQAFATGVGMCACRALHQRPTMRGDATPHVYIVHWWRVGAHRGDARLLRVGGYAWTAYMTAYRGCVCARRGGMRMRRIGRHVRNVA